MATKDKKKIEQPTTEQPTVQAPAPAEPTLSGERQQFGQPAPQGFNGGSLGVNTDLNTPTTATAAPTEQATPPTPAKSATQELIDSIKAGSEEERQRIEKRRQAEETISGIADMGKALSNLYFTGKGSPNMYDPKTAMTPKARERYERALKNWEKNRAAAMSYALSQRANELKEESNKIAADRNNQLDNYRTEKLKLEAEKQADTRQFKEWENQYKQGMLDVARERVAVQKAYNEGRLSWQSYHTRLTKLAEYEKTKTKLYDESGREIGWKETRTVNNPDGTTTNTPKQNNGKKQSAKSKVSIHNK